jgi:hypothetical protein
MTVRVIALDLEGTLVSSAVSQFPRPGLFELLEFCFKVAERVALFTSVREEKAREVVARLVADGLAPAIAATDLEYIDWPCRGLKDLAFVTGASLDEVVLIDDQESCIVPEQREQWIPVAEFDPQFAEPPYTDPPDRELDRVRAVLASYPFTGETPF